MIPVRRVLIREIAGRPASALLTISGTLVAAATVAISWISLNQYTHNAELSLEQHEQVVAGQIAAMEREYESIGDGLGYTLRIISEKQSRSELADLGWAHEPLPDGTIDALRKNRFETAVHLLPLMRRKLEWPEQKRTIFVAASPGEIGAASSENIMKFPSAGQVSIGEVLCWEHRLEAGQQVILFGKRFVIGECRFREGSTEDITIRFSPEDAAQMPAIFSSYNEVLAQGMATTESRLKRIRAEFGAVAPGVQVIELRSEAVGRAKTIEAARQNAIESLERERATAASLRERRGRLVALFTAMAGLVATGWIALAGMINIRSRRAEIALLRALGIRRSIIFAVFLGRSVVLGTCAALVGSLSGFAISGAISAMPSLVSTAQMAAALTISAMAISFVACLPQSLRAASVDPASILGRD